MGRKLSEPEVLDAKGSLDDRKEGNEEASDNRIGWDWKTAKTAVVFWNSRSLSLQGGAGGKKRRSSNQESLAGVDTKPRADGGKWSCGNTF